MTSRKKMQLTRREFVTGLAAACTYAAAPFKALAAIGDEDQFVGEIRLFGGNFAPTGWAFCEGQLLPVSGHTALFSLLGTQYGGDGKVTFALPDLNGVTAVHADDAGAAGVYLPQGERLTASGLELPTAVSARGIERTTTSASATVLPLQASQQMTGPVINLRYIIALQGIFPARH